MANVSQVRFQDEQQLARHILQVARGRARTLVGIAGIPGSGKSTLARHLRDAIGHIAQQPDTATVVPMDGFHYSNAELAARGMADRKGSPDTFHAQALFAKLLSIKRAAKPVLMPMYSRELHEPVSDALQVRPETPIVLVEGNYILCEFGVWRSIAALLDVKVFIVTLSDEARRRVTERHVQGGMSGEDASMKYSRNDAPNAEIAAAGESQADIIYEG